MSSNSVFRGNVADAVAKYFKGTDFHLVLDTLSMATYNRVYSILKDCDVEEDSNKRDVAGEAWNITHLMTFLAELYHWDRLIEEYSETEQL